MSNGRMAAAEPIAPDRATGIKIQPDRWIFGLTGIAVLAILLGLPWMVRNFPEYVAGYLTTIPALVIGVGYLSRLRLFAIYPDWTQRLLLILAFAIPLQNTFFPKAFRKWLLDGHVVLELLRPDIVLLVALACVLVFRNRAASLRDRVPGLIQAAFVLGMAGWLVATALSSHPLLSFGVGFFEFLIPFVAMYAVLTGAPDRTFVIHAVTLLVIAVLLVAAAQSAELLLLNFSFDYLNFGFPVKADEFLELKMMTSWLVRAGNNGYGNTDNFVSLCVLLVPVLAAAIYLSRRWIVPVLALIALLYAVLLVYSRSGLGAIVIGLAAIIAFRWVMARKISGIVVAMLVVLAAIHVQSQSLEYFADGVEQLVAGNTAGIRKTKPRAPLLIRDTSAVDRLAAWKKGAEVVADHWVTGVGYGVYPSLDPVHTAPHSMFLLRFAEGGILSIVGLLLFAAYFPLRMLQMWRTRTSDLFEFACLAGLACFMLKGLVFGANFSINGLVVWGFGVGLLLAGSLIKAPLPAMAAQDSMTATLSPSAASLTIRPPLTDRFRTWVQGHLALVAFLASYFVFTVLGNLIYPFAAWGESSVLGFRLSQFPLAYTFGYWALLFLPFVVAPPVALAARRVLKPLIVRIATVWVDFRPLDYTVIVTACYAYIFYAFWNADILGITFKGAEAFSSVQARFDIQEALGFWPQMVLKSVLNFLAIYAFLQTLRSRERFWLAAFLINFVVLSVLLLLLNMKWPILIFYLAIACCAFLYAAKHPYRHGLAAAAGLIVAYVAISVVTTRLAPVVLPDKEPPKIEVRKPPPAPTVMSTTQAAISQQLREENAQRNIPMATFEQPKIEPPPDDATRSGTFGILQTIVESSFQYAPLLIANGLNRMSISYPYYFQIFTEKGPICGTLGDRVRRKPNPCHPSNLIYEVMYGEGGFQGRATAPAAVHITGYALGGWSGALIELIVASILIGAAMALPIGGRASAMTATVAVMAGIMGYFLSQLPVEGPIVYDHGIIWWSALIFGYALWRLLPPLKRRTAVPT